MANTLPANKIYNFKGVAMYAKLKEASVPTDPTYTPAWEIDVLLTERDAARAKALGLLVKTSEKYDNFIAQMPELEEYSGGYIKSRKYTLKSAGTLVTNPDGSTTFKKKYNEDGEVKEPAAPPIVRDSKGHDIPQEDVPYIGNGSLVEIGLVVTPSKAKSKGEWGSRLISVQIKDLVEYSPNKPSDDSEGGFEYNPKTDAPKAETSKAAKKKKVAEADDEFGDDIPF